MNKLIIGIPIKNDLESFKEMYRSLYSSTKAYDKIVLAVGKGTNKETIDWINNNITQFKVLDKNFTTPLEAYNALFQCAKEEKSDLFLTQTDVVFPKLYKQDWLKQMKDIAQNEEIGAVTCINGGGISGPDYVNGMEWLGGWCSYYPNRTIEKIGDYDRDFPNGMGVDIDHTYRIFKSGLKIAKIDYWVHHHMQNERLHDKDPNTEQMKQDSSKYFKTKWKLN